MTKSEQTLIAHLPKVVFGCLAFPWGQANPAEDHMKAAVIENLGKSDRLATLKEIQSAMSFRSSGAFELRCTSDGYCEMKSDMHGWVRILNNDLESWALLEILMPD